MAAERAVENSLTMESFFNPVCKCTTRINFLHNKKQQTFVYELSPTHAGPPLLVMQYKAKARIGLQPVSQNFIRRIGATNTR